MDTDQQQQPGRTNRRLLVLLAVLAAAVVAFGLVFQREATFLALLFSPLVLLLVFVVLHSLKSLRRLIVLILACDMVALCFFTYNKATYGKEMAVLQGRPRAAIRSGIQGVFALSPDAVHLASLEGRACVRVYELESGKTIARLGLPPGSFLKPAWVSMAFTPDGGTLIVLTRVGIFLYRFPSGENVLTMWGLKSPDPAGGVLSLDGSMRARAPGREAGISPHLIHLIDEGTGETLDVLDGPGGSVTVMSFSCDGKSLASAYGPPGQGIVI